MDLVALNEAVAAAAPIHGVSVGRKADKSTWRIDFKDEASGPERAAAQAVIDAYDPDQPTDAEINAERDRRIALGVIVAVTGAGDIPVQTRGADDFRNINGLTTSGVVMQSLGSTDPIPFRDANDVTHNLLPAQVVELGLKVLAGVSALYAKSWAIKAADPRPTDYTDDSHWT